MFWSRAEHGLTLVHIITVGGAQQKDEGMFLKHAGRAEFFFHSFMGRGDLFPFYSCPAPIQP